MMRFQLLVLLCLGCACFGTKQPSKARNTQDIDKTVSIASPTLSSETLNEVLNEIVSKGRNQYKPETQWAAACIVSSGKDFVLENNCRYAQPDFNPATRADAEAILIKHLKNTKVGFSTNAVVLYSYKNPCPSCATAIVNYVKSIEDQVKFYVYYSEHYINKSNVNTFNTMKMIFEEFNKDTEKDPKNKHSKPSNLWRSTIIFGEFK